MPVVGAAPALAEGTAGVEPASEAEIATAAKLEALVPWAQGEAGCEVESLPRGSNAIYEPPPEALPPEGWRSHEPPPRKGERQRTTPPQGEPQREVEMPPRDAERELEVLPQDGAHRSKSLSLKGKHKRKPSPQINPNKGEHEPCWPLRESSHKDVLRTRQGPGPLDPGGLAGEQNIGSKRPVEADKDIAAGIVACNRRNWPCKSS